MKLRKLFSGILSFAILATIFTGCGGTNQTSDQATASTQSAGTKKEETQSAEKKTVTIYMEDDFIKDSYTDFYKEFEDQNNAVVKPILVPKDKYVQTFMVTVNGGQPIDILYMNGQDVRSFANKGLISDMTSEVTYWDRFFDNSVEQFTFNGKKYAVPTNSGASSGVYYNKGILDKYSLQPPKTFADLVAMNKVLSKDGIATFAFGGASRYMWPMWYFDAFAQTSGGKSVERTVEALTGKAKWTDPDFVEAMKVLENFGKENLFQKGFNGAEQAQGNAVFTAGKAALFFGGTWEIDGFRKAGMTDDKLGIATFPIVKEGAVSQQTGSSAGAGMSLYAKIEPDNKDISLKLIDYIASDNKITELNKLATTAMAPNKGYKAEGVDTLYTNVINKDFVPSTVTFLDWIYPPEIVKEFQDGIQAVVGNKISAEDEMAKIQKVFDGMLEKGYDFNSTK